MGSALGKKPKAPAGNVLGKGLGALLQGGASAVGAPTSTVSGGLRVLPVEKIKPNKTQPRKIFDEVALQELSDSIKEKGVLQPIVVRKLGEHYEIVAGERRWRAASLAGVQEIPAVVKELSDSEALQIALIENIQRRDLDPLEEAESYSRLIREHKLTHDQIAQAVGKSRVAVTNSLRLLRLPDEVMGMLADGRLTAGHARALMMLESEPTILKLARDIVGRQMSVRDAELKARSLTKNRKHGEDATETGSSAVASVQDRLQKALGTKVRLKEANGSGVIEIVFHSLEQLDGLLDKLL
jgi:ParB family chromosome partitioning protein